MPPNMTRGKIHSQPGQRSEHPDLSGNGSTQAVHRQCPTAKEAHRVSAHRYHKDQETKFTHSDVKDVSIPI